MRENQRIRWRIVHGRDKGNSVFFETCKLFGLYSEIRSIIWISTIKRTLVGFWWLLDCSQVSHRLGDHFGTTVSYLWASCVLSVAFRFQIFVPLYYIVLPYLRHFGALVPKICKFCHKKVLKASGRYWLPTLPDWVIFSCFFLLAEDCAEGLQ